MRSMAARRVAASRLPKTSCRLAASRSVTLRMGPSRVSGAAGATGRLGRARQAVPCARVRCVEGDGRLWCWSDLACAAVDVYLGTGHVAAGLTGEEEDRLGDLLRAAETLHGDAGGEALKQLFGSL